MPLLASISVISIAIVIIMRAYFANNNKTYPL